MKKTLILFIIEIIIFTNISFILMLGNQWWTNSLTSIESERRVLSIKNYYKVVFREEMLIIVRGFGALGLIKL